MPASERAESEAEIEEHPARRREWLGLGSLLVPLAIVIAVAGGIFYIQAGESGSSPALAGTGPISLPRDKNPADEKVAAREGRLAPDFALEALDGSRVRLSDLRGHPVLINFWATWCGPCRAEMPDIESVYEVQRGSGLVVVAINVQEGHDRVADWVKQFGLEFPVVLDISGAVTREYHASNALPTSFFVDSGGRISAVHVGQMSRQDIAVGLAPLSPEVN